MEILTMDKVPIARRIKFDLKIAIGTKAFFALEKKQGQINLESTTLKFFCKHQLIEEIR